jgi:hypothetical protein
MNFPVTIELKRPIKTVDAEVGHLVFDEPDLGTSIQVEEAESPMDQTLILLAGMAGVSIDLIKRMKESDFRVVTRRVLVPYQQLQLDREKEDQVGNEAAAT